VSRTADPADLLAALERLVVAAVAVTARALSDVAPELTLLQWRVLVVVDEAANGIAVGAIAARLGAKVAATSRLVGRLRSHGLVEAVRDEGDARISLVRLSPEGRRLRDRVIDRRRVDLRASLAVAAPFPEAERTLAELARQLEHRE
jgi:DNA-binding MarR family transcriptional regulator